ncbi:MAG: DUF2255 family protein [Solirubrobacteraceae bacterium]
MSWTESELTEIAGAKEVTLATARAEGTRRRPVTMWIVREADDLYVRSVNGRDAAWFRAAQTQHEGRLRAGAIEKDVALVETNQAGEQIDAAYQAKYGARYPTLVPSILAPHARAATLKVIPHESTSTET